MAFHYILSTSNYYGSIDFVWILSERQHVGLNLFVQLVSQQQWMASYIAHEEPFRYMDPRPLLWAPKVAVWREESSFAQSTVSSLATFWWKMVPSDSHPSPPLCVVSEIVRERQAWRDFTKLGWALVSMASWELSMSGWSSPHAAESMSQRGRLPVGWSHPSLHTGMPEKASVA